MRTRLELHERLKKVVDNDHVYFQPPESVKMKYPCIVYQLDTIDTIHADDTRYINNKKYTVTVIDKDPDSIIPYKMLTSFMKCKIDRSYTVDNLNHWVFSLFF